MDGNGGRQATSPNQGHRGGANMETTTLQVTQVPVAETKVESVPGADDWDSDSQKEEPLGPEDPLPEETWDVAQGPDWELEGK